MTAVPAGARRATAPRTATSTRAARASRRRWSLPRSPGSAPRDRTSRRDQVSQAIRLSAADLGRPGWEPDTGFGLLSVARALHDHAAAAGSGRAQRRHRVGRRPRVRQARPLVLQGPGARAAAGPARRVRGPGGRLPDPAAAALAREDHARTRPRSDDVALRVYRRKAKRLRSQAATASQPTSGAADGADRAAQPGRRPQDVLRGGQGAAGARDLDAAYALRVG